ncbi:hypothetical protein COU20_00005, partial [Candidatus Kaiserbacteria bacterium CG10_big_fil_rev_8_21_14_0_10_59_10]
MARAFLQNRYLTSIVVVAAISLFFAPLFLHAQGSGGAGDPAGEASPAQITEAPTTATPQVRATCDFLNGYTFDGCIWFPLMSWLGSWFLTIGGYLLLVAGTLFDTLVGRIIVDFKGTLDFLNITTAISDGWTIFRDFSNILIIGIFAFTAISIILGLHEFGQKKMIARILIIAVLINFSLLFTKMIIDASNFTAYQIYRQMAGGADSVTFDISQRFLVPMGIPNVWNSKPIVDTVTNGSQSGLQGFAFGLTGGAMLAILAGVLLYGCFLIIARGILFIFLMLTAALAFATYLIPSFAESEYGWSTWWKSLINSAIFAPLLMLSLYISLVIVSKAGEKVGQLTGVDTIGSIINDPSKQLTTNGWTVILLYILGTGLLFISFKVSSKFAGRISGFNMASMIPGLGVAAGALGVAAGARFAGFAARQGIGRPALAVSKRMEAASKD